MSTTIPPAWLRTRFIWTLNRLSVQADDFCCSSRHPRLVRARSLTYAALYIWPGPSGQTPSYPEVAAVCGKSGHASIRDGANRAYRPRGKGDVATDLDAIKVEQLVAEGRAWEKRGMMGGAEPAPPIRKALPRPRAVPEETSHVKRLVRRLVAGLADESIRTIAEARFQARPLLPLLPPEDDRRIA
jgi:hypothetical protein